MRALLVAAVVVAIMWVATLAYLTGISRFERAKRRRSCPACDVAQRATVDALARLR